MLKIISLIITVCVTTCLFSDPIPQDEVMTTQHTVNVDGKAISYKALTGTLVLKDETEKPKANFFFVSYQRDGIQDLSQRPIFFCFNGGPGCPSVWLHLGMLGPKQIAYDELKPSYSPPYHITDNAYTLLDVADLVFIDPVGTGYSRAIPVEDAKQFFGVEEDIKWMAEFIRLYCTQYQRWTSPKYLVGESYGTARAAGLSARLHDNERLYLNGVILVSSILNWQTIVDNDVGGNDLPYILALPSYTSTAWYFKKLTLEMQQKSLKDLLVESEQFALNDYARGLLYGDRLSQEEKTKLIQNYSKLTGIDPEVVEKNNLRLDQSVFRRSLLEKQGIVVGRFDCRLTGLALCEGECSDNFYDPTFEAVLGAYTATISDYLRKDLKWEKNTPYVMLANVSPWNYGSQNQYLNISVPLKNTMCKNPQLKVFVASGLFDLAIPYFSTTYTFDHLSLAPSLRKNLILKNYEGGHMMYMNPKILKQLREDIIEFIK